MLFPDEATREAQDYTARRGVRDSVTIIKMGFPGYFLIVADFINWAKNNGVPGGAGPGLRRRLAGGLRAEASPTWTRCATTCCSSAS